MKHIVVRVSSTSQSTVGTFEIVAMVGDRETGLKDIHERKAIDDAVRQDERTETLRKLMGKLWIEHQYVYVLVEVPNFEIF